MSDQESPAGGLPDPAKDPVGGSPATPQSSAASIPAPVQRSGTSTNGLAIASLVLGIVGIVGSCLTGIIAVVFGVLAIIFGAIAMKQIKDRGQAGRGLALTGLILGIVVAAWGVIAIIVLGGIMLTQVPNMS